MINWKNCNPLSDEAMQTTAVQAQQGNAKALELLVSSNVKLASRIANQYRDFAGTNVEDLTSEAMIGLIESVPTFDPERGTKFTTYAAWLMRAHVLKYVMSNFSLVKIGTTQAQKKIFWRLNRETESLRKSGIEVTDQSLADRIQVQVNEIQNMQARMRGESSLDATNPSSESGATLLDSTPSQIPTPDQYVTKSRMTSWVQSRMIEFEQRLTGNELQVWNYRIASEAPSTVQDLGDRLGVSKQRVSQIEIKLTAQFTKYARNRA